MELDSKDISFVKSYTIKVLPSSKTKIKDRKTFISVVIGWRSLPLMEH